jgi:putative peptidoglycan lipid II flippase
MQDTLFPAIYGTTAVLLSIPIYLLGLEFMGTTGVALAVSLSAILQVYILYALWNKRSRNPGSSGVYLFYLKIIGLSVAVGIVLIWFKQLLAAWINATTFAGSLLTVLLTGAVFLVLLLVAGYGFRIREINDLMSKVLTRITRKGKT